MSIYYDSDSFEAEQLDENGSIASIYSEDWSWTSEDEDQPELGDTDKKPKESVEQVQENGSSHKKNEISRWTLTFSLLIYVMFIVLLSFVSCSLDGNLTDEVRQILNGIW